MTRRLTPRNDVSKQRVQTHGWPALVVMAWLLSACERHVIDYGELESTREDPQDLRLVGEDLVFIYSDYGLPFTTIRSCRKHDCEATRTTYGTSSSITCLTTYGDALFYADYNQSWEEELWRFSASGAKRLRQLPIHGCVSLVVDEQVWYIADSRATIRAFAKAGEQADRIVARAAVASKLLEQQDYLYWGNANAVWTNSAPEPGGYRVRKDGTAKPERLVLADVGGIAVDTNRFYWLDSGTATLASCDPADCPATTQTLATILAKPHHLTLQGETLFWLEGSSSGNEGGCGVELRSCSIHGCPEGSSLAISDKLKTYVVDETSVYGIVNAKEPNCGVEPEWQLREYARP